MNLHYEIEMLSDWRCGTGTGNHGSTDGVIKRDELGLPVVPAKTITGVFRDAAEITAAALDSGVAGLFADLVERLFGSQPNQSGANGAPVPAALRIRRGRMHESFRYAAATSASKASLVAGMSIERPGVSIDSRSGRAQDASLRFHEYARVGIRLYGSVSLAADFASHLTASQTQVVEAFLAAVCTQIEALGGKRRRGSGRCALSLFRSTQEHGERNTAEQVVLDTSVLSADPPSFANTDQWFYGSAAVAGTGGGKSVAALVSPDGPDSKNQTALSSFTFLLTTESSLCIQESANGNVVTSASVIPGRFFLPAVLKALGRHGISASEALSPRALRITNAFPVSGNTVLDPAPFSLLHAKSSLPKQRHHKAANLFGVVPETPHKPLRDSFVPGSRGRIDPLPVYRHAKTLNTHNSIDDKTQRPTSDLGGLFSVEAIPPGTRFCFEIHLSPDLQTRLPANWEQSLHGSHEIGKSSKDDYGLVDLRSTTDPVWRFHPHTSLASTLYVSARSIVLLRDKRLRPTTLIADLVHELRCQGLPVTLAHNVPNSNVGGAGDGDNVSQAVSDQRLEGWQRQWGLSAPSQIGIAPGTVLRLQLDLKTGLPPEFAGAAPETATEAEAKAAVLERLNWIERWGIGERTTEGYGSLSFQRAAVAYEGPVERQTIGSASTSQTPVSVPQIQQHLCETIAREMWRRAIEKHADGIAGSPAKRAEVIGTWSNKGLTQLGSLRSNVRLIDSSGTKKTLTWLEQLAYVENRSSKWNSEAIKKVRSFLTDPELLWAQMAIMPSVDRLLSKTQIESLKRELWPEALRTLLAECARAEQNALKPKKHKSFSGDERTGLYQSSQAEGA